MSPSKEEHKQNIKPEGPVIKGKRPKKRDRLQAQLEEAENTKLTADEEIQEPVKKKRKNRTQFEDPRADETLSNQSRKALEYAFMQMNRPSKWKFNKARQNWLIRNVWSPDEIPDAYFPLIFQYLSKIQGGSRQKLRETGTSFLTEAPEPEAKPSESQLLSTKDLPTTTEGVSGPLITTSSTPKTAGVIIPPPSLPSSAETLKLASIRKARAEQLLAILQDSL